MDIKEKSQVEIKQDIYNYLNFDENKILDSKFEELIPEIKFYKELKEYESHFD